MSRDLKNLLRFALENSDGTTESTIDPEKARWLSEFLATASVDLSKQLKEHIETLSELCSIPDANETEILSTLQDILSLTEDLDLANDFFKMDGTELLLKLLFTGPSLVRPHAYQLLSNLTQNNPEAQKLCLEHNVLQRLILCLPDTSDLDCLRKLLLGISCLTRGFVPGVRIFLSSNGYDAVLDVLERLCSLPNAADLNEVKRVRDKGSFLIYCLLQDTLPDLMDEAKRKHLVSRLIEITMRIPDVQEHLLASLIMLFHNAPSVETSIDIENIPGVVTRITQPLASATSLIDNFVTWLDSQQEKTTDSNEPAHAEQRLYIGVLKDILVK
ncbi:unnamed protein product [Dicrocoelium dendriticum]|nr:unnamed protein product [Dicrocoelium dendriticum]